jgi:hypothetical protein
MYSIRAYGSTVCVPDGSVTVGMRPAALATAADTAVRPPLPVALVTLITYGLEKYTLATTHSAGSSELNEIRLLSWSTPDGYTS